MHKFIIGILCISLAFLYNSIDAKAQTSDSNKKVIVTSSQSNNSTKDLATDYLWRSIEGAELPIYLHKFTKGKDVGKWGAYVIKISNISGKEYKYYIPDYIEVANEIIKESGFGDLVK